MNTLRTAIKDYLLHCRYEKNLSPKTLKAYQADLAQLETFLQTSKYPTGIADITKHQLREYLTSIGNLKPKSIKRKVASIKALFNYLEFEDRIVVNPLRKMRIRIKEPRRLPVVLDLSEVIKIFKGGYKAKKNLNPACGYAYREAVRNIAVLELLFSTGARVSEIAGLRTENINLQSGNIVIRGKGDKERIIQVCNPESLAILTTYHALFNPQIEAAGGRFLINRLGQPLSDQSIRAIVKNMSQCAGLTKHVTPHIFRHSFATLLLEKDVDIKYIQSLLGHSSINTTQIYTHVNRKRQRQILTAKHPRREFSMDYQEG